MTATTTPFRLPTRLRTGGGGVNRPPRPVSRRAMEALARDYRPAEDLALTADGAVPLTWWVNTPNFGDLLSPWLVSRMTGRPVTAADPDEPHYVAVGSILKRVAPRSIVWGTGSFGNEDRSQLVSDATYTAVRGPLSRSRLLDVGAVVPEVYGDPALLTPVYYRPRVRTTHEIGVVARWSETRWRTATLGPGIRLIDLGTDDVEGTIDAIAGCRQIVTASLHGLVLADAYQIPSAWVPSRTAVGGEFKFLDYFASVDKVRRPQRLSITNRSLTVRSLRARLDFDGRRIRVDLRRLLDASPFVERAS